MITLSGNILVNLLGLWFYHQDAKIFLKQAELVKLMIMPVTDTELHPSGHHSKLNTENTMGLSM